MTQAEAIYEAKRRGQESVQMARQCQMEPNLRALWDLERREGDWAECLATGITWGELKSAYLEAASTEVEEGEG